MYIYNESDTNILNELIQLYEQVHFNNKIALLDINLIVKYVSKPLLTILNNGITDPLLLTNINLIDSMKRLNRPPEIIQYIEQSLAKVINENHLVENINIDLKRETVNIVLQCRFTPLHNRETGNIIAIEALLSVLNTPLLLSEPGKLLKHGEFSSLKSNDKLLTRREHEVLFLHFQCKSAKEISQQISAIYNKDISLHTIGRVNYQLYKKFNVYNQNQLIIEARKQNYHKKIPVTLLSNRIIDIQDL